LNCRAAEALFHGGRRDEALECGRRAFALAADDRDTAYFCAWLFSNCGCHQDATAAYERLLAWPPDWAEGHRHLSGSLAAIGDFTGAVAHAIRAVELMPDDNGTAIHAAELLLRCGDVENAAELVRAAAHRDPGNDRVLRVLSAIECCWTGSTPRSRRSMPPSRSPRTMPNITSTAATCCIAAAIWKPWRPPLPWRPRSIPTMPPSSAPR
jgi:tetratricopeptide (TPR) repeat protein